MLFFAIDAHAQESADKAKVHRESVERERRGILCVSGERKGEKEDHKRKFHRIERSFGNFRRSFTLPEDTDSTKVTADFRDGVLKVHLPTTTIAKTKAVEVKVA